jgi:hypothetical protein
VSAVLERVIGAAASHGLLCRFRPAPTGRRVRFAIMSSDAAGQAGRDGGLAAEVRRCDLTLAG